MDAKVKREKRQTRARRVRSKIKKVLHDLPRLSVYKSNTRLIAQVIDDTKAHTLAYLTTSDKEVSGKTLTEKAENLGKAIAEKAKKAGVEKVVFDRGGSAFTGVIKKMADAARDAGLKF